MRFCLLPVQLVNGDYVFYPRRHPEPIGSGAGRKPNRFPIGWAGQRPCSMIFEMREDGRGEYYYLVTFWKLVERYNLDLEG
jgi:hypothetical protein